MEKISILLVDDHSLVRAGIRTYLDDDDRFEVIAEAGSGEEAIEFLEHNTVNILMIDLNMEGMGGIQCTKVVKERWPKTQVIAMTMLSEAHYIKQMLSAGANGYLLKDCSEEELKIALVIVNGGGTYYSSEVTETVMSSLSRKSKGERSSKDIPLTDREIEILDLIIKEYSNKEIAEKLFISNRTVDAHKRNLLEKTGAKNIAGLVMYAVNKGLTES